MRISDWSSDVCSSDLIAISAAGALVDDGDDATRLTGTNVALAAAAIGATDNRVDTAADALSAAATGDRKRVVLGKGVSVRVDRGGRRIMKKKKITSRKRTKRERKRDMK